MCWHCDSVQNDYCGEPFTGDNRNNTTAYIECLPKTSQTMSVCVKTKVNRMYRAIKIDLIEPFCEDNFISF